MSVQKEVMSEFTMIAKTMSGLEEVLYTELQSLGAKKLRKLHRAVEFMGNQDTLYRANLALRSAVRVLVPIHYFSLKRQSDLYEELLDFPWERFIQVNQSFAIHAQLAPAGLFSHSHFVELKVKDALVDYFWEREDQRPNVDTLEPEVEFHIHVDSYDQATLMLDSSGEPLFKRGYRQEAGEAPINEALAAGILLLSGWHGDTSLLDPFCGSGTFLIEAAYLATNTAPNLYRKSFGLMNWIDFDEVCWKEVKRTLLEQIRPLHTEIIGRDIDPIMIEKSRVNIDHAHLFNSEGIVLECSDFFDTQRPSHNAPYTIVSNLPYGKKLDSIDFSALGTHLKHQYAGVIAWLMVGDPMGLKDIGLKPSKKYALMNAPIECSLACFELFSGKRKDLLAQENPQLPPS